jgi:4-hydroxybenzoate polyprenyltransferase
MDERTTPRRGAAAPPAHRMRRLIREPGHAARPAAGPVSLARGLVVELRPAQWIKNLTCLAGLIFSGRLLVWRHQVEAALAFACFCAAASAVYILNDIVDRKKDRLNPRTARRPIAAGTLPVPAALVALAALAGAAAWGAAQLGPACAVVLLGYALLNVGYSLRLKHVVIADVMCIALGFVLRVLFGVYAVGVLPTPWIALCMFFLALFLGFAKRKAELARLAGDSAHARPVLAKYGADYLDMLLTMSAATAILCYALFTVTSHQNPTLVVTVVPVVYCVNRYLLQVALHGRGASPDRILLSDRRLWFGITAWLMAYLAVMYWDIRLFAVTGETARF